LAKFILKIIHYMYICNFM